MSIATYQGIVENGQILLTEKIDLPDKTKVYVVVPEIEIKPTFRIPSPRLVNPEDISVFEKEVEEDTDAKV